MGVVPVRLTVVQTHPVQYNAPWFRYLATNCPEIDLTVVYAARPRVAKVIRPTPLMRHPLLAAETGLDIQVKHENHNPTGAFKVRGGLNLIGSLTAEERRGVITATTGNHGQSIALACQREGVPCTIVTPIGNNPEKNAAMRALGADVIEFGNDFDEAREKVEQMRVERGLRYVHTANEPLIIAGVATCRRPTSRGHGSITCVAALTSFALPAPSVIVSLRWMYCAPSP